MLFIALTALMLVLMSHDIGNRGGTDVAGQILFKAGAPAVKAGSSATSFVTDLFQSYVDLRGVRAENRRLTEALERTERERDAFREQAAAGRRLEELLGMKQVLPPAVTAARVAGSGFASGNATLLIDRGSADGVSIGMPVVAVGGIVGKVVLTWTDLAKVQCITDPASGAAVVLQESGYQGILVGRSPATSDSCELEFLPPYAEVGHGDLVVTSGLDQIYPRGIAAGRIVGLPEGSGLARKFEVKPGIDFRRIAEVLVLRTPPRTHISESGGEARR